MLIDAPEPKVVEVYANISIEGDVLAFYESKERAINAYNTKFVSIFKLIIVDKEQSETVHIY